jgi:release factor glutamine methyltransferase
VCVAHLVGRKEFRGLDFMVTPDVLVPRPDTETLVEAALDWIDQRASDAAGRMIRAIDVCTGSGCVAVSVKAERPDTAVAASDVSEAALEVARRNAERLLAPPRSGGDPIDFHLGDLLAPAPGPFDLIVSNPPYIPSAVVDTLSAEVRKEPRLALDGGRDGLDLIRRLVRESFLKLNPHGRLLIEAGYDQSADVAQIMRGAGFTGIGTYRDLAGIERVTGGTKP